MFGKFSSFNSRDVVSSREKRQAGDNPGWWWHGCNDLYRGLKKAIKSRVR